MRLIAEAGTDGATLALWDPAALPEEFDARYRQETLELLEALQDQGRLYWTETGSDGSYLLHVYLDEPVPAALAPFLEEQVELRELQVPGGTLWFAGAEYTFRVDDSLLRAYPHQGTRLELPSGSYQACVSRVEYPEDYVEEQLHRSLGDASYRIREVSGRLIAATIFLSLTGLVTAFLSRLASWSLGLLGLAALGWVAVFALTRSRSYREAGAQAEVAEREFPDYVAELRTLGG
jgi:hypothetical protein